MSAFAFLLFCIQACLVQNNLASCYRCAGPIDAFVPASGLGSSCGYKAGPYVDSCGYSGVAEYGSGLARYGSDIYGYGAGLTGYGAGCGCRTPYGGAGIGNVAVAGELPVGGATAVAGQVPIIGAVEYAGPVAAAGTVTIAGNCACGCNAGPYGYGIY